MDYKVLYRKYRPINFEEIVGQEHIKKILVNSIKNDRIAHAYIFTGPRGTGKTSTAKIFAKTLNCLDVTNGISCDKCENCINSNTNPDVIEIDAASNNGVDNIREIIENIEIAPSNSKYKIYIIDEVHMLSNSAWNAFLKTLEEPPKNVIFILATTDIQKVPITVLSRCQRFDFSRIDKNLILNNLIRICELEKISYEHSALEEITYLCDGCMRDALSILDQLSKMSEMVDLTAVKNSYGAVSNEEIDSVYNSILKNNIENLEYVIDNIKQSGIDIKVLLDKMLDNFINKAVIMKKKNISSAGFSQLKSIIEVLNNLYAKIAYTSNGFLLLKLELLSFINDDKNVLSSREINQIISKNIVDDDISVSDVLKKKESYYNICDDFINIRINNSFVNANKQLKQQFTENWKKYSEYVNENLIKEFFTSIRAVPQVCSDTNVLFVINSDSLKTIANNKLFDIENSFNSIYKTNYKFIFISKKDWDIFMKSYNKDTVYTLMDETEYINKKDNSYTLAGDTFGSDNINIE